MNYFAVIREAGPLWIDRQGAFEQPGAKDAELANASTVRAAGRCGDVADQSRYVRRCSAASAIAPPSMSWNCQS